MSAPASAIHPLHALRVLQPASGALLEQLALYGRLIAIEWAQERSRLAQLLVAGLLAAASLQCLLLGAGAVLIALCWSTPYRIAAVVGVLALYALGTALAWRRLRALAARGADSFAVTRSEFAADLALLRSRL
jgi:uncharacterized membrane protein YqjE